MYSLSWLFYHINLIPLQLFSHKKQMSKFHMNKIDFRKNMQKLSWRKHMNDARISTTMNIRNIWQQPSEELLMIKNSKHAS
jgi:hypothetical protein